MQDPIENRMLKSTVEGQLSAADSNTIIELNSKKNQFRRRVSRINTKIFAGVVICALKQLSIYFKTFFLWYNSTSAMTAVFCLIAESEV